MFIREKVLECRQQEGTKASALPIRCRKQIGRQHVDEELLRQVLGVSLRCALPADVGVERIPIHLAQSGQRFLALWRCPMSRIEHRAPLGRVKPDHPALV